MDSPLKINILIGIAGGGAMGAVMRYWLSTWVYGILGQGFPYGTLTVNVLGSLAIGILYVLLIERLNLGIEWRAVLIIGFLGSFTTFSSFSLETFNLIEQGEHLKALWNMFSSVALCVGMTWFGVAIARQL
jgi:CrcB protein